MTTSQEIGQRFLAALCADDFAAMGNCLTPAVRLRALLPRRTVDVAGREAAMELLSDWLGAGSPRTVVDASADVVGQRLHLSYRVLLADEDGQQVMEQQAYCDVTADGISSVRLLCAGHMPAPDSAGQVPVT